MIISQFYRTTQLNSQILKLKKIQKNPLLNVICANYNNIDTIKEVKDEFYLHTEQKGKPTYKEREINGITHKIVDINGKRYIPYFKQNITKTPKTSR